MDAVDFVVLGAGLAGLAFAKRVSEAGRSVLLLEKEPQVGGLARTLQHDGYFLDLCAHRFHTSNAELLGELLSLPGLTMTRHLKKSRIYMFGKYLKYPFEIQNLLRAMPLSKSVVSAASFAYNYARRSLVAKRVPRTYKDWFVDLYGERLYDVMCYPYTSKIWRMDPSNISADWADARFQGESMAKLVRRILGKLITLDFSSYSIEDDSLAPDGGVFYYPERGIGELPSAMCAYAEAHGARVKCGVALRDVSRAERTVTYESDGEARSLRYGTLVSTIPLHSYYALQEKRDAEAEEALARLRYMDIIFVYAFVDRPSISKDHWLYFPDEDIIFNRAVEFSNWSSVMCPRGKTSVCFDITAFDGDQRWSTADDELARRVLDDAERAGYLRRADVVSYLVHRVKYAYPVYDLDYRGPLTTVVRFLEDEHSLLLGRTGIFRYNNSDNSIEMGFELAKNVLGGQGEKSVFAYRFRDVSL